VIEFGKLSDDCVAAMESCGDAELAIDDTELDCDMDVVAPRTGVVSQSHAAPVVVTVAADPFAEEFDEEEVVLDNFAAWDDMFCRDVPRVENRRDPGFSTLVQDAIEASPVSASRFVVTSSSAADELPIELLADRPRLRLADVPDATSSARLSPAATAGPKSPDRADSLGSVVSAFASHKVDEPGIEDENPVLVIEEDAPANSLQSPVRREEYRHLFSRLRSG